MLNTDRLTVRPFAPAMAEALSRLSMETDNRRFLPDEVWETPEAAARVIDLFMDEYQYDRGPLVYAVTLPDGTYIGHVEAAVTSDGCWEAGVHIGADYGGRGYGAEALGVFLPWICDRLALDEILGICVEENIASWKTLEKCGFQLEFRGEGRYQGFLRPIRRYVWRPASQIDIDVFWQDFVRREGLHPRTPYKEAFCFDESDAGERLLGLVLDGRKTATCSSMEYWKWLEETPPEPGDFSIITDRAGCPRCVIETMEVHPAALNAVPWELARLEGEDDCPESWLQKHNAWFAEEARRLRYDFREDQEVILEVFEVVWKG